jgi:hypothetical protein
MKERHKSYKIAIEYTCNNVKATYNTSVIAVSKHHAIELALTRCREIQPDRSKYSIVSAWDRNTAQDIAFLAIGAYNYALAFS